MDQTEKPIKTQFPEPEEELHHENGASKMFKIVKARAKKFKNSITKNGQSHEHNDHDVVEEDDELEPEVIGAPARGGVTDQPGSQIHPKEANVSAPEKIVPPETKEEDPVTSGGGSDYLSGVSNYQSKVNDLTHEGGEAEVPEIAESLRSLKVTDESSEQKSGFERDLPTRSHGVDRETESVIGKDSPARFAGESGAKLEKHFPTRSHECDMTTESGINKDSPSRSHEFDLKTESGVNKNSLTGFGGESKTGLEQDSPRRSYESDHKTESGNVKNSTTGFDGELAAKLGEDSPTRSYESDQKTETKINKNSPTGLGSASIVGLREDFPAKSHELGLKNESGSGKDSPTGYNGESGSSLGEDFPANESNGYGEESEAESLGRMNVSDESPDQETGPGLEKDLPTRSHEFDRQSESGIGKDSPKRFVAESGAELGKDLPTRSHEFDQKTESKTGKDSPARFGAESGAALGADFSTTELKRDLPTGTHDQFSPELSRPKERDDFKETKDETTHQTKPSTTYTEKLASATLPITDKVIAAKDAVASKLGYSGESGGGGQYESSVRDETPRSATGYGKKVAGTVAEKLTPVYEKVKEIGSNVMTKLPLSGGGGRGGVEETQQGEGKTVSARDYISGKLRPGEEEKALSEVIAEKLHFGGRGGEKKTTKTKEMEETVEKIPTEKVLEEREHGEAVGEEGKGGRGTKPKSPHSFEESSQSLGPTVGTTGFSDSGGSELTGETGVGSGAVPVQRGLEN